MAFPDVIHDASPPEAAVPRLSLTDLLAEVQVGRLSLSLGGRAGLSDVSWSGTFAGTAIEFFAPQADLHWGHGATVVAPRILVQLPDGAPPEDEPHGSTEPLPVADLAPEPEIEADMEAAAAVQPSVPAETPAVHALETHRARFGHAVQHAVRLVLRIAGAHARVGDIHVRGGTVIIKYGADRTVQLTDVAVEARRDAAGVFQVVFEARVAAETDRHDDPTAAHGHIHLRVQRGDDETRLTLSAGGLALPWALALAIGQRIAVKEGSADLFLTLAVPHAPEAPPVRFEGAAVVREFAVQHRAIASEPVQIPSSAFSFSGAIDGAGERISFGTADGRIGEARADLTLRARRHAQGVHVESRIVVPEQPCPALYSGIPRELMGDLTATRWRGRAGLTLALDVDTADVSRLQLTVLGEPDGCRPVRHGRTIERRLRTLGGDFRRPVDDPSGATPPSVRVGPGTDAYVPLDELPAHLSAAAITTEDREFFEHLGVSLRLIQGALRLNMARRQYVYGGSTITQQLVKNLLLTREKSIARKVQEAFLAREVERRLDKERILSLYLNCIEYGPGIYGIGPAAQFYFGKDARTLTPLEGAFLMALKPSPRTGFMVFRRGTLNERWRSKMHSILHRIARMGTIPEEEVEAAAPYQPAFRAFDREVHRGYP